MQVVNLLVTPEQAELLSLASNQAKLQLVLRNPLDTDTPKTPSIAVAGLFSDGAPEPIKAAAPKTTAPPPPPAKVEMPLPPRIYLVQVLNGSKKSEEKFSDKEQKKEQQ